MTRTNYEVVWGPDSEDRQLYVDYGDGQPVSTTAELRATRCFLELAKAGVPAGFSVDGVLTHGVHPEVAPPRGPVPPPAEPLRPFGYEDLIVPGEPLTLGVRELMHNRSLRQFYPETGRWFCVDCLDDLPEDQFGHFWHVCAE